jgi:hypothetical protein
MSFLKPGDQIAQLYSNSGRAYTVYALTSVFASFDKKHLSSREHLALALDTIFEICCTNDKSRSTVIPKSTQFSAYGND